MCDKGQQLFRLIISSVFIGLLVACTVSPTPKPVGERVTGRITAQSGQTVEYQLLIPQNWIGKYEIREKGNIIFFDYNVNPDLKETLFSITALSENQWQEAQKGPHGEKLLSREGIVFVYNIALANPYTGNQADEFQQMAGQIKDIVGSFKVSPVR